MFEYGRECLSDPCTNSENYVQNIYAQEGQSLNNAQIVVIAEIDH